MDGRRQAAQGGTGFARVSNQIRTVACAFVAARPQTVESSSATPACAMAASHARGYVMASSAMLCRTSTKGLFLPWGSRNGDRFAKTEPRLTSRRGPHAAGLVSRRRCGAGKPYCRLPAVTRVSNVSDARAPSQQQAAPSPFIGGRPCRSTFASSFANALLAVARRSNATKLVARGQMRGVVGRFGTVHSFAHGLNRILQFAIAPHALPAVAAFARFASLRMTKRV